MTTRRWRIVTRLYLTSCWSRSLAKYCKMSRWVRMVGRREQIGLFAYVYDTVERGSKERPTI